MKNATNAFKPLNPQTNGANFISRSPRVVRYALGVAALVLALVAAPLQVQAITRGELMARFLDELALTTLSQEPAATLALPVDVPPDHPHAGALARAMKYGFIPSGTTFLPDETVLKREGLLMALHAMGWGFEANLVQQLDSLPDLAGSGDPLLFMAAEIKPRPPEPLLTEGDAPLADEEAALLVQWLGRCRGGVIWNQVFSWEGTDLVVYRQGMGKPGSETGYGQQEPLYIAAVGAHADRISTRIALAREQGVPRLPLSAIVGAYDGVIGAINGGYFSSSGGIIGTLMVDGKNLNMSQAGRSTVGFSEAGQIVFALPGQPFPFDRCTEALQGGPMLIANGRATTDNEGIHRTVLEKRHPRTLVGIDGTRVLWAVIDGRNTMHSTGATMEETRNIARSLGFRTALNLDGGGSTTLWWRGIMVNRPSDGKERPIPYAILMMPHGQTPRPLPSPMVVPAVQAFPTEENSPYREY